MHWIDPESLPELQGTLEQFVLNPHGEVDGFVMTDGTAIRIGPKQSRRRRIPSPNMITSMIASTTRAHA